ncbi:glycosyltransferase family 4 protein [Halococcus sediminicola]|uniref:glycosyltransferase family 4 protein n=1 Tax=Halococcus sediminicola TaxID=1264579 RepID=UPI0006795E9B|nr:glycosyltransferase family 4 protein [Halococcus sediminicola]
MSGTRIALCPHLSVEHYRGGEKWVCALANRLAADGIDVSVRALPYAPGGERRVDVREVLDSQVPYRESWHHDLSEFDTAYVFYNPFSEVFFSGGGTRIAGIHSWVYVSKKLYEAHYGLVPTTTKLLYRLLGKHDLSRFDVVHSVTPAYESPHPNTVHIPNFVDAEQFTPDRRDLDDEFTVLTTAAHIREKGWDTIQDVAARLPPEIRVVTTGDGAGDVEGLGFLTEEELADAYARAHVVLHPARVDTDSMVINEACASGTPVVTTPLSTHVRENEAVLQAETARGMAHAIARLHGEWLHDDGYEARCRRARAEGESHSFEAIYPRLKSLLVSPPVRDENGPTRTEVRA